MGCIKGILHQLWNSWNTPYHAPFRQETLVRGMKMKRKSPNKNGVERKTQRLEGVLIPRSYSFSRLSVEFFKYKAVTF